MGTFILFIPHKLNIIYVGLVLLIITPVLFIHMLCDLQLFNEIAAHITLQDVRHFYATVFLLTVFKYCGYSSSNGKT